MGGLLGFREGKRRRESEKSEGWGMEKGRLEDEEEEEEEEGHCLAVAVRAPLGAWLRSNIPRRPQICRI